MAIVVAFVIAVTLALSTAWQVASCKLRVASCESEALLHLMNISLAITLFFPLTFKIVLACGGNGRVGVWAYGRGKVVGFAAGAAAATRKLAASNFWLSLNFAGRKKQFESRRTAVCVRVRERHCVCVCVCVNYR